MNAVGTNTSAPPGFSPPELWPEFGMIAIPPPICRREKTGTGTRWCLWPLCFELYTGDDEPDLSHSDTGVLAYNRIIVWKRIRRAGIPAPWHSMWPARSWRKDGLFVLTHPGYRREWSKDAQRNAKKWDRHRGTTHAVERVSFEEYKAAYAQSITKKRAGLDLLATLERQHALPEVQPHVEFVVVRNKATGAAIAGNAVLNSPTYGSTMRICPFMLAEARDVEAMTGLIDEWFAQSYKRGIKNLVFIYFWQKGDPKEWKGFSTFKSHFVQRYVTYPPLVWRFKRGRLL